MAYSDHSRIRKRRGRAQRCLVLRAINSRAGASNAFYYTVPFVRIEVESSPGRESNFKLAKRPFSLKALRFWVWPGAGERFVLPRFPALITPWHRPTIRPRIWPSRSWKPGRGQNGILAFSRRCEAAFRRARMQEIGRASCRERV